MNLALFFVFVLLYVALAPGVLLSLPARGSKLMVALTHGLIFALVWVFTWHFFKNMTSGITTITVGREGADNITTEKPKPKPPLYQANATPRQDKIK